MNPPPNPHAAAARADIAAYNAPLLANPPHDAPPPDLLDRVFDNWPDMARYRDTATVERMVYWLHGEQHSCWFVTVTAHAAPKGE